MSFTGKYRSLITFYQLARACVLLGCLCVSSLFTFAQSEPQNELDNLPIPPPFIRLATDDRVKLATLRDPGDRLKAALVIADARIDAAERATLASDYDKSLAELAYYQGLVDNILNYLLRNKGKRDQFKRLEIALRGHAPRLETIRRTTPAEYAEYIRQIMDFARDARSSALEPFFSPPAGRQKSG